MLTLGNTKQISDSSRQERGCYIPQVPGSTIRETPADRNHRKKNSAMIYASELHMSFNHANMKMIREAMSNQLQQICSQPAPMTLTCAGFLLGKLSRHPHKLKTHTYKVD